MTGTSRRSARGRFKSSSSPSVDGEGDSIRYPPSIRRGKGKELVSIGAFKANLKILIGLIILGIIVIYFVINRLVSHGLLYDESQKPRVITPFPAPKLMDLSMVQQILYSRFVSVAHCCSCEKLKLEDLYCINVSVSG